MLPTTGYFKHINCPFYDSGLCERPYCHFRHGKKGEIAEMALGVIQPIAVEKPPQAEQNNMDEDVLKHLVSETVKKVLSHAEILSGAIVSDSVNSLVSKVVEELKPGSSVNSELAPPPAPPATSHRLYLPPAGTPSYKPTPIAQLKRHVPVPYIPSAPCRVKPKPVNNSRASDHEKPKTNFSISNKEYVYKPSSYSKQEGNKSLLEVAEKENSEEEQEVEEIEDDKEEEESEDDKDEEMETEDISQSASVNVSNSNGGVEVDGVDVTNELDMLNEILTESDNELPEEEEEEEDEEEESNCSKSVVNKNKENEKVKGKSEKLDKSESDKVKNKKSESDKAKDKKLESDKVKEKKSESDKVRDKKSERDKAKEKKSESDKAKDKKSESDKVKDKKSETEKVKEKKLESNKRRHSRSSSRSHSQSHSSSSRNKENEKHRSRSKHSSHKRSHSESSRSSHKRSSSSSHKSHSKSSSSSSHKRSHHKESHSSTTSKSRSSAKSSSSSKSSRRSSDDSSKSKRSKKEDSHSEEEEEETSSEDDTGHESDKAPSITFPSPTLDDVEFSESDEDTVMQECRRIFEEYKPQPKQEVSAPKKSSWSEEFNDEDEMRKKKRVAHEGARSLLPVHVAPKPKAINPVQAMTQRLMKIKEVQEQKKAMLMKQAAAPAFSQAMMERIARIKELKRLSFDEPKPVQQPSSSNPAPTAGPSTTPGVKIASVQNVQLLLNAKNRMQAQLEMRAKKENSTTSSSTIAQTAKRGQRVAHVPSQKVLVHPVITNEAGGKFPANFRQKHLDHLVQQYIKLTGDVEYSTTKGKETENEICERATSRMVYSSIMATTINKIRKECEIKAGERSASTNSSIVTGSNSKGSWSMRKGAKEAESGFSLSRLYQLLLPYVLSQEDLVSNGYPRPHPEERGMAVVTVNAAFRNKICNPNSMLRTCGRCGKSYTVNKFGLQIKEEQCVYHWGHLIQTRAHGGWERRYTCCSGDSEGVGCGVAQCHVSDGFNPDELRGYVKTLPVDKDPDDGNHGVYAVDCEMCYTTSGLELTRVTMVDSSLNTVYETLVKPSNTIIDYNTRFSGITEEDMKGVTTSIFDVQATLLSIVHEKTILIGHSLESDFKALKIIHDTVVDTSVVFPHRMGPPKKRALKNLCRDYLKKIIQESVSGHDSAEDAKACMELMIWKLQNQAA